MVIFRTATVKDLNKIVQMLADDELGRIRERYEIPLPESYLKAFEAIDSDPNNELIVSCLGEEIIGVLQITFTPHITHQGSWRATIEGVRTASSERGKGIGSKLILWAIERAKERGCHIIQLTTDKKREDAFRFYERIGFEATHEGLKMKL
ncbi:GNAT family N-acetyltransferase [Paenibacillus sp. MER 180]|uniref:GNAT family N-acetyltransferase n=1 Tax=unclassified Paenibacillus TaxID=185978 RepID=UPI0008065AE7|nr:MULTISPECIES: GNAT family N-acetyltransferase [unclassified Paenibacillus]MCM3293550.1 GNAT family N-acetyltransferase [Paenibacillus sp. MER 180]OBY78546.1 GNAT family acetyltransferase [Paenibacillus sp. KS1]